ncbi:MAG TPA: CoA transferase [Caulobacteraceae bacterium]|jgi:crotonobetainyl-CoA:carnitine CoA-transferase CaiB-like acyl-CoA transferase|nr:CoA transferase [Caulobacteraceae bacterium]
MSGPLAGLKVLDFTQALAGPFCTQQLSDLGAEVVKVEALDGGDLTRRSGPFHEADPEHRYSGYFQSVNRGKQSMAVDLKTAAGVELVKRLLPEFDVVVENFRVGVMERLGLAYETLAALNPKLVYCAIRGFGDPRTGVSPYVEWPAYDVVAQAMGGMMGITGLAGGQPIKIGPGVGDTVPALYAALGIVSAVLHARETGRGQFLDVAMTDAILGVSERIVHQHSFGHLTPGPEGNHHPFLLPFGVYPAADGFVALACPSDAFFRSLCAALGAPEVLDDPDFATSKARAGNREAVIARISELTARLTKAELQARLGGVAPFGPVLDIAEIAADEHFAARNMLAPIELPGVPEPLRIAGQPIKFAGTPAGVRRRGPELGEHTASVLRQHGATEDDIARWRRAGAIPEETP